MYVHTYGAVLEHCSTLTGACGSVCSDSFVILPQNKASADALDKRSGHSPHLLSEMLRLATDDSSYTPLVPVLGSGAAAVITRDSSNIYIVGLWRCMERGGCLAHDNAVAFWRFLEMFETFLATILRVADGRAYMPKETSLCGGVALPTSLNLHARWLYETKPLFSFWGMFGVAAAG